MSSQQAQQLRERGIEAVKAGQKDDARKFLQASLRLDPSNDTAWLWLASVANDKRERLLCLKKALEVNPNNDTALKAVRALGIEPSQLIGQAPPVPEPPPAPLGGALAPEDAQVAGPGVPIPDSQTLSEVQSMAEEIVQAYLAPIEAAGVNWTRKTKRRAGEREIVVFRLQIAAAVAVFLSIIGIGAVFTVLNVPEVRLAVFGASSTPVPPTRTPTNTPTNTPGFTPTPSPTRDFTVEPTFTSSPTIFPSITPGRIDVIPRATPLSLPVQPDNIIRGAISLIDSGDYEAALQPVSTARAQSASVFSPYPYYYQALAYLGLENDDAALESLNEAEERLDNLDGVSAADVLIFRPLIDLGFAEVYLWQGEQALARSNSELARTSFDDARTRAQDSISGNPLLARGYVIVAESYRVAGNYDEALNTLNNAQTIAELAVDVNLIVEKARTYLDQGQVLRRNGDEAGARGSFDSAAYEAYYTLYINPRIEEAHLIQIEAALALGDPGLAVLYSQAYQFYFPEKAEPLRLQGDARVQEGNIDLALAAYDRAIAIGGADDEMLATYLSRGGLYSQQRRYAQAQSDYTAALELADLPSIRALRLRAAFAAGDYDTAQDDAESLQDSGVITNSELYLIQARILVDTTRNDDDYSEALGLLNRIGGDLPSELGPVADEYRARAHFALGNFGDALNAVNRALGAAETGSRHYLRGQIFEAGQDFPSAMADYEWVLTWAQVYDYPFSTNAAESIERIRETIARQQAAATATAITATAAVRQATATSAAQQTATSRAATVTERAENTGTAQAATERVELATATRSTATAAVQQTATARIEGTATAQTATADAQDTRTAEAGASATAEAQPTATPTPEPSATEEPTPTREGS